ncbi:hypothetical protein SprV_0501875900 [Sparganum proliferum]
MIKRDDGVELYKDDEKAEHLSRFFQSVFTRDVAAPADHYNVDDFPTIDSVVLTTAIVQQELLKLKEAKSPGPDEIPAKLLKELATELAEPLCLLFQASLDEGRLPPEWKTAWISPIHKSGSRASANNYRPVSLTSICCKVMERIIKRELMRFLEQHHLLSNAQHGFRRGRSCLTNLLYCLEQWSRAIDEGNVVHVAYIDFKKAFDSVPHQLLLYKLGRIRVRGKLLKWIENFLIGRSQTVRLGGQQSAEVTVTSGVPQGSVLGPILFLIYIDDCIHGLDCDIAMFADDIKLWTVIRNEDDEAKLQANLDRLEQWSGYWLLPFNVSKCNILRIGRTSSAHRQTYYLNHTPLPVVEVQKDLEPARRQTLSYTSNLSGDLHQFFLCRASLSVVDSCLMVAGCVVISSLLRHPVLRQFHAAHPSTCRVKSTDGSFAYGSGIDSHIDDLIRRCSRCQQAAKMPPRQPSILWQPSWRAWSRSAGSLNEVSCLILADAYSKWPYISPQNLETAPATIAFLRRILSQHGLLEVLV